MDQNLSFVVLVATFVVALFALLVMLLMFLYISAKRKHLMREQAMKNAYESELLRTELEIAEEVTNQLSQELHDDLGQLLSHAIHLHKNHQVEELGELLPRVREQVRNLSHNLHNAKITEVGLDLAIDRLCNQHYATYSPPCAYTPTEARIQLTAQEEVFLFRCVQQAIENAYKHAEANNIHISLKVVDNTLVITIKDDGKGFDTNQVGEGIGLISIKNRVKMVGGILSLSSQPGAGTTLRIEKQLPPNEQNTYRHSG